MDIQPITDASGATTLKLSFTLTASDMAALAPYFQQPQPVPVPVPVPTPTPIPTTGFRGIYVFSGDASSLVSNPSIAGTYLGYPWAVLNPKLGQYVWDSIERDMAPWVAAGKKIILRVSASGWTKWVTPNLTSWTPSYVYAQGVKSVTEDDGAIKPQYWHPAFLQAYTTFAQAFAAKYDGDPRIVAIEMGIGDGGETKVDTRKNANRLSMWQKIGYTDDIWLATIGQLVDIYKSAFVKTPLVLMPDDSFIGGKYGMSQVLDIAVTKNVWLQDNGVVKGEVLKNAAWAKLPLVAEQMNKLASGESLADILQQAIVNDKAIIAMCFAQDLVAADPAVLAKYAGMVTK